MKRDDWKDAIEIVGVIAIVASLIFVAMEIRTNTQSNEIAIEQNYAGNWLVINSQVASNDGWLKLFLREGDEDLSVAEKEQLGAYVRMLNSQSFHMLRLYDQGLVSAEEVRGAFRALREFAASSNTFPCRGRKDWRHSAPRYDLSAGRTRQVAGSELTMAASGRNPPLNCSALN